MSGEDVLELVDGRMLIKNKWHFHDTAAHSIHQGIYNSYVEVIIHVPSFEGLISSVRQRPW